MQRTPKARPWRRWRTCKRNCKPRRRRAASCSASSRSSPGATLTTCWCSAQTQTRHAPLKVRGHARVDTTGERPGRLAPALHLATCAHQACSTSPLGTNHWPLTPGQQQAHATSTLMWHSPAVRTILQPRACPAGAQGLAAAQHQTRANTANMQVHALIQACSHKCAHVCAHTDTHNQTQAHTNRHTCTLFKAPQPLQRHKAVGTCSSCKCLTKPMPDVRRTTRCTRACSSAVHACVFVRMCVRACPQACALRLSHTCAMPRAPVPGPAQARSKCWRARRTHCR